MPLTEPTLTMFPERRATICGKTACAQACAPLRLDPISSSHPAGSVKARVGCRETPALLMRTCTSPKPAKAALTASASAMSATAALTVTPSWPSASTSSLTFALRSSAAIAAPSAPKKRQSHWPMPPAAPVIAMVLPAKAPLISSLQRFADPAKVSAAQVTPVVERELVDPARSQRLDCSEELAPGREIGMGRPQDAAEFCIGAAQPPADVEEVGLHAHRARFIEAGLDDAGRLAQRLEIAAFVPGAAGRAGDGRDHCYIGVLADGRADFGDERGHDAIAEIEV